MKNLKNRLGYALCILLGCVFYLLLMPLTAIQATILQIKSKRTGIDYFMKHYPISHIIFDEVMKLNAP